MTLAQTTLKTEFLKLTDPTDPLFAGFPLTKALAALNWCNAYNTYTLSAVDVSNDALVGANLALMKTTLTAQLPDPTPAATMLQAANAFDAAFVSYWTGATFGILIPILPLPFIPRCPNIGLGNNIWGAEATSSVTTVTPGVLSGLLVAEFAVMSSDVQPTAAALATAFHTATLSAVFVTIVGVDTTIPTPLPISNICTIT